MRACLFLCAIGLTASVAGAQDVSPFYDALSRETLLGEVRALVAASTHQGRRARKPA